MRHTSAIAAAALAVSVVGSFGGCSSLSQTTIVPETLQTASVDEDACAAVADLDHDLKVANYNIKSGIWTSLDKVEAVLKDLDADVVALEEVDRNMHRSGNVDQAAVLAKKLHASHVFVGAWDDDKGSYGIALLSRLPIVSATRVDLPRANGFEPRVAIDAVVCAGKTPVRIVSTHTDFLPWAAAAQAEAIATRVDGDEGVVVLGDFNAKPGEAGLSAVVAKRNDALALFDEGPTFPGFSSRLDHILTGRTVKAAKRIVNPASDHFAVTATIELLQNKTTLASSTTTPTAATQN